MTVLVQSASEAAQTAPAADGGIFGAWGLDEHGLPVFDYTLDQRQDPRAEWSTIFGAKSRLHWHQLGNDRIIAIATDEGWVQLYSHEHGPRWINRHRADLAAFSGGVSYLHDPQSGETWSTFFSDLPTTAKVSRRFGCGYLRIRVSVGDIELDRAVFAPFGDGRLLASHVRVTNQGTNVRRIRHGEYWDCWIENIDHHLRPTDPFDDDIRRERALSLFGGYRADWDDAIGGLRARHPLGRTMAAPEFHVRQSPPTRPDVICAPIGTAVHTWAGDRQSVFGDGSRQRPAALTSSSSAERTTRPTAGEQQDTAFLLCTDLVLQPGETVELGFGYGAAPPGEVAQEVARLGRDSRQLFEATATAWKHALPDVGFDRDPWLSRELAWGAYYVRSGAAYHEGMRAHTISQGGGYQYQMGMNTGPRATLQHALPFVWLGPELAAECIRFTMAETAPDGEIPYGEVAGGLIDNHFEAPPSDGDLWLLLATAEYVLATRDRAFLRQSVSYWPAPYTRPEPVWDHCVRAFEHLFRGIGVGPHGLLKMRPGGDWGDVLPRELAIATGVTFDDIWAEGESTLNTAMAVHVLRRFGELAEFYGDPATARRAREHAEAFAHAVQSCWRADHVNRGWADSAHEVGYDDLFAEPQAWALIAGCLNDEQATALVATLRKRSSDPLGTRIFDRGETEGKIPTVLGGVWLSINSTLAWGLSRVDPHEAWQEFIANTLHNHAITYPEVWEGVWSGPDMYLPADRADEVRRAFRALWGPVAADDNGPYGIYDYERRLAGRPMPPLQAWPIQIMFAHSEPLNTALWLMGISGTANGIRVEPRVPCRDWHWDGGLLALHWSPDLIHGEVGALASDVLEMQLVFAGEHLPRSAAVVVDDRHVRAECLGQTITFSLPVAPGRRTPFRVEVVR
jgi:hypothetical protein